MVWRILCLCALVGNYVLILENFHLKVFKFEELGEGGRVQSRAPQRVQYLNWKSGMYFSTSLRTRVPNILLLAFALRFKRVLTLVFVGKAVSRVVLLVGMPEASGTQCSRQDKASRREQDIFVQ